MDAFAGLMNGFAAALSLENLYYAFVGSIIGTLVGILPGVGSAAGMAILIPLTFKLPATGAIIMLSAIFYGSYYGGTITTVLMGVPGESASAITLLDGYQMAKQGRGGAALSVAAIGSFIGGTFSVFGLVIAAPVMVRFALKFGPTEFFSLMMVATALLMSLAGKSILKALMMGLFGFLIGTVGMDPALGAPRFTFGSTELMDGVNFVPVVMGLFGLSEILTNIENPEQQVFETKMSSLVPSQTGRTRLRRARGAGNGVRLPFGLDPRHHPNARLDLILHHGGKGIQASGAVRTWGYRGCGRTGDGKQLSRQCRSYTPVYLRHSRFSEYCDTTGRLHDERPGAGSFAFYGACGSCLDGDREFLHRQFDAAHTESSGHPPVGEDF